MSATVDVNILLYASDESSSFHAKAAELLDRLARGPYLLYLFWPVVMGYLRMATHSAIFPPDRFPLRWRPATSGSSWGFRTAAPW